MYELKYDGTTRGDYVAFIAANSDIYGQRYDLNEPVVIENYATLERHSYFPLIPRPLIDAQTYPIPYNYKSVGVIPSVQTNEDKNFTEPLVLTLSFSKKLSFSGFKLYCRDVITSFNVSAFSDDSKLYNMDMAADTKEYFINRSFESINKVVFTIKSLDVAHRFFWLYKIDFGIVQTFDKSNLVSCKMDRSISLSTQEAPISSLEFEVKKQDVDYLFREKQPVTVLKDGVELYDFFVSESEGEYVKCQSVLSDMKQKVAGKLYETATKISVVLADIFLNTSGKSYELDGAFTNKTVTGCLPSCTVREALIYVAMATGAVIDDSRTTIRIRPPPSSVSHAFTDANTISNSVKTEQKTSSVILVRHEYSKSDEKIELYNWYMAIYATRKITFSEPAHSLQAYRVSKDGTKTLLTSSQFQFLSTDSNYCNVKNTGITDKIIIEGKKYTDSKEDFAKSALELDSNVDYKTVTIENATLLSSSTETELNRFFDYYAKNKLITCQVLNDSVKIGDKVNILGAVGNVQKITSEFNGISELEVR